MMPDLTTIDSLTGTVSHIASALSYLLDEAKDAGLENLAELISTAEEAALDAARHAAMLTR